MLLDRRLALLSIKLATEGKQIMEHDVVLTCGDGSKKHFRIYGRPAPDVRDSVGLPVDGQLIKARVNETHGVPSETAENPRSIDHLNAVKMESS